MVPTPSNFEELPKVWGIHPCSWSAIAFPNVFGHFCFGGFFGGGSQMPLSSSCGGRVGQAARPPWPRRTRSSRPGRRRSGRRAGASIERSRQRDAPFGGGGGAVFFEFGAVLAGCAFSFCCGEWVTGCLGFERCLVGLVVGVQSLIHKLNTFRGSVWTGQGGGGVFGKVSLSNLRVNALCMNT